MASGDSLVTFTAVHAELIDANFPTLDARQGRPCLDFDASTDERAHFTAVLPRNYAGGGVTVTVIWAATSATSGTCRWEAAFERLTAGGTDLDANNEYAASQSAGGAANASSGVLTYTSITFTHGAQMDSVAAGDLFRVYVHRDADGTTGTDDMTGDAELYGVEIRET